MRGRLCVAPATRFVSHAWSYVFTDLVSALDVHAEGAPEAVDAYFWIGARSTPARRSCAEAAAQMPSS